ncbi:hypothetical protein GPECTOR_2g1452 [Gonium pectorale]|uniref:F-box domain-containing protein n=1 Tax=Gonium pectorale TaxID=33097 RepID=A0A150H1D2_GONPE|nr:hypothetical protein GPECTOR_2g1452 [Gonium pectorale]|eukprot:KXZ55901.1 hypothetical protein GPECTOR_2g1452 [Gonium pectorale]
MPLQQCAGCGCEIEIDSGLLWCPVPGQAEICCNKRCVVRAQRRRDALASGKPCSGKCKIPPAGSAAIEPECGWGSLSGDVLAALGSRMPLRDRLAAALTCKHWRTQMTRGVTHGELRICDLPREQTRSVDPRGHEDGDTEGHENGAAGADEGGAAADRQGAAREGAEDTVRVLDSGRTLLPQLCSLRLTVADRCHHPDLLRRHLLALGHWSQLRELTVDWEVTPVPLPPPPPPKEGRPPSRQPFRLRRRYAPRAPPPPAPAPPTIMSPTCLGLLGLLTGLQTLSLTARFEDKGLETGLRGLSSLEGLTRLELLRAPPLAGPPDAGVAKWHCVRMDGEPRLITILPRPHPVLPLLKPWSRRDGELAALTRLRCLRADAELLSPPLLEALPRDGLTQLVIERLELQGVSRGGPDADGGHNFFDMDNIGKALERLLGLRTLQLNCYIADNANEGAWAFTTLLGALRRLTQAQLQQLAAAGAVRDAEGPGQHSPARRRRKQRRRPQLAAPASPSPAAASLDTGDGGEPAGTAEIRIQVRASPPWQGVTDTSNASELELTEELLEELSGVVGLTHLDLIATSGDGGDLGRLSQLTALTTLALRFAPACQLWDPRNGLWGILTSCRRLTCLTLYLQADLFAPPVLAALELLPELRQLELVAYSWVRYVPYTRTELRGRLLRIAQREGIGGIGGAGDGGDAGGAGGGASAAAAAAAVGGALPILVSLQEVFVALVDVEEVRQALVNDAQAAAEAAEAAAAPAAAAQAVAGGAGEAAAAAEAALVQAVAADADAVEAADAAEAAAAQAAGAAEAGDPAAAGAAEAAALALAAVAEEAAAAATQAAIAAVAAAEAAEVAEAAEAAEEAEEAEAADTVELLAAAAEERSAAANWEEGEEHADLPQEGVPAAQEPQVVGDTVGAARGEPEPAGEAEVDDGAPPGGDRPRLPLWVLLPVDPSTGGPGDGATAAAAGEAAAPPTARLWEYMSRPLHELSFAQLLRLRSLLLREELVTGPAFLLDQWAPGALERLSLRGFKGLTLSGGAGSGRGGVCWAGAGAVRPRRWRLPELRELMLAVESEEAAAAARATIEAWVAEDPERAPQLGRIVVTHCEGHA